MKFKLFFIIICLLLSGCGQSGKLYLPYVPDSPNSPAKDEHHEMTAY